MKKLLLIGCLLLTAACQSAPAATQAESAPQTTSQTPPPPATATSIPTLTPVPTASPTSTPVPMFFTEDFNADLGAWASFQTGGAQPALVGLENDLLRIDFASPDTWYYAIHNAHEYSSVNISAKFFGTASGSIGVVCNYSETNGWYEFNLASDGTYSVLLGQWLSPEIAQYTPIVSDTTEYLQAGILDHEVGLTCQDNLLFLFINGKLFRKLDVSHIGLAGGKVGISAASYADIPMTATFDWVQVSEPGQ
ncbi:MAG: hypothetical protein KA473_11180 [Anaerolineales bacterium]|nr:hypothetical protein [Anaerolineales bacterium]MBP6209987.1 hypothetical protein [Anaerolineales bacterium]MBP8164441.1 hypothetical protein [Anaerolineales bacterium]